MPSPIPVALKSQNVCWSCRVGKQRCDKSLPSCSRCTSKLLRCEYARADPQQQARYRRSPSPDIAIPLFIRPCPDCLDLSAHGARELLQVVSSYHDPSDLARLISRIFEAVQITISGLVDDYFATVNRWLPVIDEELFRSRLSSWPQSDHAGLTTLIWTIYLVTRQPCADSAHSMCSLLYQTTRQMLMLQASKDATIEYFQAGLLVTYYACGHGLPRDAHMTLATCVAIGRLMGLDFEDISDPSGLDSQLSVCRWATVLLDRTVVLSSLTDPLPLALPLTPTSYSEWLASVLDSNGPYRRFAVLSKVAILIGTALGYANDPRPARLAGSTYSDTYDRLEILLRDLIRRANTEPDAYTYCDSTSLAVIALLGLQTVNPSSEKLDVDSKEGLLLQSILRMVRDQFHAATYMVRDGFIEGVPVMALCFLSRAGAMSVRLCGDELPGEDLDELRFNLRRFGTRWTVGRVYLEYIDEITRISRPNGAA